VLANLLDVLESVWHFAVVFIGDSPFKMEGLSQVTDARGFSNSFLFKEESVLTSMRMCENESVI